MNDEPDRVCRHCGKAIYRGGPMLFWYHRRTGSFWCYGPDDEGHRALPADGAATPRNERSER